MRDFPGDGSRISLGAPADGSTNLSPSMTISCWAQFDALGNARIVDRWGLQYLISLSGSGWLGAVQAGGQATCGGSPAPAVAPAKYHVCMTVQNPAYDLYVNGNRTASGVGNPMNDSGGGDCCFGSNPGGEPMNGRMSHVAFWKGASAGLNAQEVLALSKGVSPYLFRRNQLVGYWPLWGLASPEPDLSGRRNFGTVVASAIAVPEVMPIGPLLPLAY